MVKLDITNIRSLKFFVPKLLSMAANYGSCHRSRFLTDSAISSNMGSVNSPQRIQVWVD